MRRLSEHLQAAPGPRAFSLGRRVRTAGQCSAPPRFPRPTRSWPRPRTPTGCLLPLSPVLVRSGLRPCPWLPELISWARSPEWTVLASGAARASACHLPRRLSGGTVGGGATADPRGLIVGPGLERPGLCAVSAHPAQAFLQRNRVGLAFAYRLPWDGWTKSTYGENRCLGTRCLAASRASKLPPWEGSGTVPGPWAGSGLCAAGEQVGGIAS